MKQCPICNNNINTPLCSVDQFQIVKCPECECDYVINPPSEQELERYYSREEWFEGGEFGGYDQYDEQTRDSLRFIGELLANHGEAKGSILDLGCGYGSHLKLAADHGWKCFGVEPSEHARSVAIDRLGEAATIVSNTKELIPHTFNIILMLDVLEHVSNPYKLLYPLFALGAIQPQTIIIATTPNAGSVSATSDPAHWEYRHPPSHLTYFTNTTLETFFCALRFSHVKVEGMHATQSTGAEDRNFSNYSGLLVTASGSDFHDFMQERYVPSTWSEIAEYEHFPRYELACRFAANKNVLDFGCGTGYGSAMLAAVAETSLGVDIDKSALDWACRSHRRANLSFVGNNNFLEGFEDNSFDLITCFEMIEHVTESDQEKAIAAFARVLRQDGVLLISTPNPEITSLYGANPYHLRERDREEFVELLRRSFQFVQLADQYALTGVFFTAGSDSYPLQALNGERISDAKPLAYIAVCSHQSRPPMKSIGFLDTERDYISGRLQLAKSEAKSRLDSYQAKETAKNLRRKLAESEQRLSEQERQLYLERNTKWARLGQQLRSTGAYQSHPVRWAVKLGSSLLKRVEYPFANNNKQSLTPADLIASEESYTLRKPLQKGEDRPFIIHAIANFSLGGSSRLVVDLIESLSDAYEQPVVTRHIPRPAAYLNLKIYEYSHPASPTPFIKLIEYYKPIFVHIHYWGECDQDWYEQVFKACEIRRVPVIQNINTPIAPHISPVIAHNVYVSDFVRATYGGDDESAIVIHPGSDLDHFCSPDLASQADDCIGMVYRMESDKLNSSSIDVFIKVAQRRRATHCLIVGDGALKPIFEQKVAKAGMSESFTFTGFVPYRDLPSFYRQMSLFVAPVWKESFGQVSSFAMNMGLPVVGYSVGAIPTIIGDEGLLAQYGDSEGLAQIIIGLLDDRPKRLRIGKRNHAKAQGAYSVAAMIKEYSELYASMKRGALR